MNLFKKYSNLKKTQELIKEANSPLCFFGSIQYKNFEFALLHPEEYLNIQREKYLSSIIEKLKENNRLQKITMLFDSENSGEPLEKSIEKYKEESWDLWSTLGFFETTILKYHKYFEPFLSEGEISLLKSGWLDGIEDDEELYYQVKMLLILIALDIDITCFIGFDT